MDTIATSRLLHALMCIAVLVVSSSLTYFYLDKDMISNGFAGPMHPVSRIDLDMKLRHSHSTTEERVTKTQESVSKEAQEQRDVCNKDPVTHTTEPINTLAYEKCLLMNYTASGLNEDMLQKFGDPKYFIRLTRYDVNNAKGADIQEERFVQMRAFVQRSLHNLQNPRNCSSARKVRCSPNQWGFGSAIHHVTFCLMYAYATNRTFVVNTERSAYGAWDKFLRPLSDSCSAESGTIGRVGRGRSDRQVVNVGMPDFKGKFPRFIPPAMPREILEMGKDLEFDIMAWWIGEFLRFIFKFTPELEAEVRSRTETIGFQSPIVGMHIRRTDKLRRDAKKFSVEEYMEHAERFYDNLASVHNVTIRRVYLATDDPSVITEIKTKYPAYTFLGDYDNARSAKPNLRSSVDGLKGIILDLFFLSRSDFLICTFSSNVCRAAYELRQSRLLNASSSTISLDCHHFFFKHFQLPRIAQCPHYPSSQYEIGFAPGDLITSYGSLNNGYSVGKNLNKSSDFVGIYPSHKAKAVLIPYSKPFNQGK